MAKKKEPAFHYDRYAKKERLVAVRLSAESHDELKKMVAAWPPYSYKKPTVSSLIADAVGDFLSLTQDCRTEHDKDLKQVTSNR